MVKSDVYNKDSTEVMRIAGNLVFSYRDKEFCQHIQMSPFRTEIAKSYDSGRCETFAEVLEILTKIPAEHWLYKVMIIEIHPCESLMSAGTRLIDLVK